jgi:hypothetical protein
MKRRCSISLVVVLAWAGTTAYADLWQNVWRGLDVLATPLGSPLSTTADGTRINGARSGRLRIVPNGIGGGYELQLDRTFGADSRGRPENLNLYGVADITLDGATQLTLGYNGKGAFRTYSGDLAASNLTYSARTTTGAQDVQLVGVLNVSNAFEVNPLGFYTVSVNVRNTESQLFVDGVAVQDKQATNFDIGPIVVRGNLFYDATLGVLTALGADTTELEKVFPRSPAGEIDQAIRDALQNASVVAGTSAAAELSSLVTQTVTDQAADDLLNALVGARFATGESGYAAPTAVPEPGTLVLFATGAAVLWYSRRRG